MKKSCAAPKFTSSTPILPPKGLFGLRSQEKFYGTERSVSLGFASLITEQRVMGILTAFIFDSFGPFYETINRNCSFFIIFGVKWWGPILVHLRNLRYVSFEGVGKTLRSYGTKK